MQGALRFRGLALIMLLGVVCGWGLRRHFMDTVSKPQVLAPAVELGPSAADRLRLAQAQVAALVRARDDVDALLRAAARPPPPPPEAPTPTPAPAPESLRPPTPAPAAPANLSGVAAALQYHPRPTPAAGHWRCPHADGCRYVQHVMVFKGFLGEQFSQQRLAVMETIHVVKALGPRYVLVEPLFIVTPHDNVKIEARIQSRRYSNTEDTLLGRYLLPASRIYDLQRLGEYFAHGRVVLWEDFRRMRPPEGPLQLDLLVMDHGPVDNTAVRCAANPNANAVVEFFNETYRVSRTLCLQAIRKGGFPITTCQPKPGSCYPAGRPYRTALLDALAADPGPNIGLFQYRSMLSEWLYQWIEDADLDYIPIRRKLLFSQPVWEAALQIVGSMPRPIVAMHIRRGDKLTPDPFRTLDKAILRINRVLRHTGGRSVFLMTDIQSPKALESLNRSVGGIRRHSSGDWRREVQDMFVEMAVCCLADYFIASGRAYWASATPSRDIIEVRNLVFGYDKHTTFWFGKPGERWTGKVIDTFTHAKDLLEDV